MEKSKLAGNAITTLHEEDYLDRYAEPLIGAGQWLNVKGRVPIPLNGDWYFAIDPFDTGLRQRWFEFERGNLPIAYDWNPYEGETCAVPSVWNLLKPELHHFEGGAWYARTISDLRERPDERLFLRIGAAYYCARVFLDGKFLGRHLGGSTPFCLDITDHLDGPGALMIHVENRRDPARLPTHHIDWFPYGGLHRDVALYAVPAHRITDFFLRYEDGAILAEIETTSELESATLKIPELDISNSIPLKKGVGKARIVAKPELWAPGAPRLYEVTVSAGADQLHDRIGFRTLSVSPTRVLVNGQPYYLKGIGVHEDDREMGRVTSEEDIRRRFRHARELGANFLRLAHYPHHERAAEIADEEGVMLWEELPVYWSVDFNNPATRRDANNQLSELIRRDRNRASVIIWGLANETADTEARHAFMAGLAGVAKRLDPSRLLSAACLYNQESLKIEDRLADLVDVVGLNEYFGWYDEDITELASILDQYDLGKPLLITETGCDVVAGLQGGEDEPNTEDFGRRFFREQIAYVENHPAVSGFAPWILYDFRTERRQNRFQRGWNRKGLIAEDKSTKKSTFAEVAAFYDRITSPEEQG